MPLDDSIRHVISYLSAIPRCLSILFGYANFELELFVSQLIFYIEYFTRSIYWKNSIVWGYKRTRPMSVVSHRLLVSSPNKMKVLALLFFLALHQSSAWANLILHGQPLFTGATSFTFEVFTSTLTKPTVCYITSDEVSQCRRRRGIEEKPRIIQFHSDFGIAPSAVLR